MRVKINCDMGEGFGKYRIADDASIMPLIDQANIACGFHASDPVIMRDTVAMAADHGVAIGAHPSLPDLQGFGRREMKIPASDLFAMICYQVGALAGMLIPYGVSLSHLKPHGALYGMACRDADVAQVIADVAKQFDLPVLGLPNTLQEKTYVEAGVSFVGEFFADLEYQPNGHLAIVKNPASINAKSAATRAINAIKTGTTPAIDGSLVPVNAQSICVHSDNPGGLDLIKELRVRLGAIERVSS
ncbi:5-oxoprolinase subunit PxpA [Cognatishimia sp. 1_MG-2023]|uniref:5-oxoprolinase subunit PxpA n=1 Tax=Cognatishimia sp. 1_MG-2023 TaxID=3062642 RepID=UPI0026E3E32E|nr:5-oxoprolinase subunit PxpA [Cognatishimia sp. 1_MG-2023]MDO6728221.1 5-oxoprolinase subunit PxpA [Cognatishimia sp. 1_MG-2023]